MSCPKITLQILTFVKVPNFDKGVFSKLKTLIEVTLVKVPNFDKGVFSKPKL
jgi:hypothetical protein